MKLKIFTILAGILLLVCSCNKKEEPKPTQLSISVTVSGITESSAQVSVSVLEGTAGRAYVAVAEISSLPFDLTDSEALCSWAKENGEIVTLPLKAKEFGGLRTGARYAAVVAAEDGAYQLSLVGAYSEFRTSVAAGTVSSDNDSGELTENIW